MPVFFSNKFFVTLIIAILVVRTWSCAAANRSTPSGYIGSESCAICHAEEYRSFVTYAKKSRSFESIERLKKGLSDDEIRRCYSCHTTGYGRPGGFVNSKTTPRLKNAGCEVCHGPGALHARTSKAMHIKKHLSMADCEVCHTSERVTAFRYKPLIHGGAH